MRFMGNFLPLERRSQVRDIAVYEFLRRILNQPGTAEYAAARDYQKPHCGR
jgi:hypothetical protein